MEDTSCHVDSTVSLTDGGSSSTDVDRDKYKVGRLIESYGLDGIGQELESKWTTDDDARSSLRELADYFNKELLGTVLDEHDVRPMGGEIDTVYRALRGDTVSSGIESEVKNTLRRAGVDIERIETDFVTHQAIYTYLTEFRNATLDGDVSNDERQQTAKTTIQRLRSRAEAVTNDTTARLRTHGALEIGDFDVIVDISVVCNECGTALAADRLFDQGHCQCYADEG